MHASPPSAPTPAGHPLPPGVRLPFPPQVVALAAALRQKPAPGADEGVWGGWPALERHRVAPALAKRPQAPQPGPDSPPHPLRRSYYRAAGRAALLQGALAAVGRALGEAGIPWAPIKGGDLAFRVYERPEERPCVDLDVLVPEGEGEAAVAALEGAGWQRTRRLTPAERHFRREEAYCQPLVHPRWGMVEVHYRLWGAAPAGLAGEALAAASPDRRWGRTGRCVSLAHAFLLAAFHAWTVVPPRPLLTWWDLERIATTAGEELAAEVLALTRRWSLQLPVGLAAAAAASLWPLPAVAAMAAALAGELRWPERAVLAWARRRGADATPYGAVVLARLLARRPSRHGWRSLWRRVLPHPALREAARAARRRRGGSPTTGGDAPAPGWGGRATPPG